MRAPASASSSARWASVWVNHQATTRCVAITSVCLIQSSPDPAVFFGGVARLFVFWFDLRAGDVNDVNRFLVFSSSLARGLRCHIDFCDLIHYILVLLIVFFCFLSFFFVIVVHFQLKSSSKSKMTVDSNAASALNAYLEQLVASCELCFCTERISWEHLH